MVLIAVGSALRRSAWDLRGRTAEAIAAHATVQEHEARLRDALGRIQTVTDRMAASVAHISKDLRYLWASRRYSEWLGVPLESLIGRPLVEFIGEEARRQLEPQFRRVLAGERVEYEEQINVRGIGRRWVSGTYVPTRDAVGEVDGWVAVVIDITKRKRIEESLRESEQWRLIALDAAQLGAWDYRCETGVVVRDERSRQQVGAPEGPGAAEAEGERIHPDDRPLVANAYARDRERRRRWARRRVPRRAPRRHRALDRVARARSSKATARRDGPCASPARTWTSPTASASRPRPRRSAARGAARGEAEEALAALREADQRKDEFLAMLAHELRNPLAPIRNAVEVMRLVGTPNPQEQRAREIVDRQLTHLTRLVDDLLEVSRITRGKIGLSRALLTLSDVVDEAIETARPLVEQHEHTLSVVHAPTSSGSRAIARGSCR